MPHKVLFVDDDLATQNLAKTVLEFEGLSVEVCGSAEQALRSFQGGRPDMVIMDIGLPDGNGLEVCRRMGMRPGCGVTFLFLTGRGDLLTRLECFHQGAHDYIQKPFAVDELLARVKVHLQLKRSRDELVRKASDLELRNRARQDLTDMIVHDLKAPLTSIKGTLELVKDHGMISPKAYRALIENAGTAAEFMLLMLNDLLDIGQAEEAGLKTEIVTVEVRLLLAKLKAIFAGRFQARGIRLECKVPDELEALETDPNLLFRILVNLVSNALKFSATGAEVGVECSLRKGAARFAVSDRGPGVPKELKARIFEKYATHSKGLGEGGSSGIGLAFCRLAISALGGRIWVEDREGGGSLFILELSAGEQ